MQEKIAENYKTAFFVRIHSITKLLISLALGVIVFFIFKTREINLLSNVLIGWDTFSLCMILMSWITFSVTRPQQIRTQARVQDTSRTVIFIIILISTLASFFAVLLLILSKKLSGHNETYSLAIAIAGMLFSWFLIHTIFAIRYAHVYYGDDELQADTHAGGLEFPDDDLPDFFDFAYFSFVLGMTFQVSDVQITSKQFRRLALLHGLLSFGFNTIMIALTINLIAGF
ncbi:MAG: DUF1345 domain-containing protein [Bacteroidota bacterium]|nr:DUF1345 domain-containing protein [Bacteroidota bacterium]